jgi:hypothetical protein
VGVVIWKNRDVSDCGCMASADSLRSPAKRSENGELSVVRVKWSADDRSFAESGSAAILVSSMRPLGYTWSWFHEYL